MKFDSIEWRQRRDEKILDWCRGDCSAAQFLYDLNLVIETWDDLIDRDNPVSSDQINTAFIKALIGMNGNAFFHAHAPALLPTLTLAINAWLDANELERSDSQHERMWAFFLRNLGMDVFIQVALLRKVCTTHAEA